MQNQAAQPRPSYALSAIVRAVLAFVLACSMAMPAMAFPRKAYAIDGNTFSSLVTGTENASVPSGEVFSLNMTLLLSTLQPGLMLPNTKIVIEYSGGLSYVGSYGMTCAAVDSDSGSVLTVDVVEPTGNGSTIPDGFGPDTGLTIAGNFNFRFPAGTTPDQAIGSMIVKVVDDGTVYKEQTVTIKADAANESWKVSTWSPANNGVVDPTPADENDYAATFTSTVRNETQTLPPAQQVGYIYTDTLKYTQTIALPDDVYFPYTASDVKLASEDPDALIKLTPPAGIDPADLSYTATIEHRDGKNRLIINWTVSNLAQPTASLDFSASIKDLVDWNDKHAIEDPNDPGNPIGYWYDPFERAGAGTSTPSVTREVEHSGSISVAPITTPTTFGPAVDETSKVVLRDTLPPIPAVDKPEGTSTDLTAQYFDKNYDGDGDGEADRPNTGKQPSVSTVDRGNRAITYTLNGIRNMDDRKLTGFSIRDTAGSGGWDFLLQSFRGITVGAFVGSTSSADLVPNPADPIFPQLKYEVSGVWFVYGQVGANAGNPDVTVSTTGRINLDAFLADYQQQTLGNPGATEIEINGVELFFKEVPRQFMAKNGSEPKLHFRAALQDSAPASDIENTVKLTYTAGSTTKTIDSHTTVEYVIDTTPNVSQSKSAFVERTTQVWDESTQSFVEETSFVPVSGQTKIMPGDVMMYEVYIENNSLRELANLTINDTLDPRTKLLASSDPRWASISQAAYTPAHLTGSPALPIPVTTSSSPVKFDTNATRDPRVSSSGTYPVVNASTVTEYLGDNGSPVTSPTPIATSELFWAFEGNLEDSLWNEAVDPAVRIGPGGKITVRYLVTVTDPDSAEWPANLPKPAGWDDPLTRPDAKFNLQNKFKAEERIFLPDGTILVGWTGREGSSSSQVIVPGIEVGLVKTPSVQTAAVGQSVEYTVSANNNSREIVGKDSRQALIGPAIIDLFPAGFTFQSIESVKLIDNDDNDNTIDLTSATSFYTVTPIQQQDAATSEMRNGIEVSFDNRIAVYRHQTLQIKYKVQVASDWGDKFVVDGAPVSTLSVKNNVALFMGERAGSPVKYKGLTAGQYASADATMNAWLAANGYDQGASPTSYVQNNRAIDVWNPILRPTIAIAPINGLGADQNVYTDSGAGPLFRVTIDNADTNEVYKSTIGQSAVEVLIPNDLDFDLDRDASGVLTAAGVASLVAAIQTDHNADGASIDVQSGRVDEVTLDDGLGTITTYKRLSMLLASTTDISNLDVATIDVPTVFEATSQPDMFSPAGEQSFDVRTAIIPNVDNPTRAFYFTGNPTTSPEFKGSDVWEWEGLVDGVESDTTILHHCETPIPYVKTLISGSLPPESAVWNASATTSRGSDVLVSVTARNYGDADIVNGKLYTMLPIGFIYKGVVATGVSVGVGSQMTNTTPTVVDVGGLTLLEWDVERLANGYSGGVPSASAASSGEISLTIRVGSGQMYGAGHEFISFLAPQEVVLGDDGAPVVDGDNHLIKNFFYSEARPQSDGVRDYLGNVVGFPTTPASTENIRVSMTDERDADIVTGFYDLNGDGDLAYQDYEWNGSVYVAKAPVAEVTDRAVRHAAVLNLTGQFNMKFNKLIRAWDSDTDSWGSYATGNAALETVRGGKVEYSIALTNEDDFRLADIKLIDIFPYADDMGSVLQSSVRGSTFDIVGAKAINLAVKKGTSISTATPLDPTQYSAGLSTVSHMVLDNNRTSPSFSWDIAAGTGEFAMDPSAPTQRSTALKVDVDDSVSLLRGESIYVTFELDIPYNALISNETEKYPAYNTAAVDLEVQRRSDGAAMGDVMLESTRAGVLVKNTGTGIGDFVWRDLNEDGIQDADEEGINGLIVELWQEKPSGYEKIGETMTDYYTDPVTNITDTTKPGHYFFDSIADGTYRVRFSLPLDGDPTASGYSSYEFSPEGQGVDPEKDSNAISNQADTWYGFSEPISISASTYPLDRSIDCGLICYGALIGDMVWYDANENGLQDDFVEPVGSVLEGIGGVTVELYRVNAGVAEATPWMTRISHVRDEGNPTDTTPEGYYAFGRLPIGDYQLKFSLPADGFMGEVGWRFSPAEEPGGADIDSDVIDADGWTRQFYIASQNDDQLFWDCGLAFDNITIGDTVWHDRDGNGLQDDFDDVNGVAVLSGVPEVTVNLYQAAALVDTTVTDEFGRYAFTKLAPGDYTVEVKLPEDPVVGGHKNLFTSKLVDETAPEVCSAVDAESGMTDVIQARGSRVSYLDADAGISTEALPIPLGQTARTGDGLAQIIALVGLCAVGAFAVAKGISRRRRDEARGRHVSLS